MSCHPSLARRVTSSTYIQTRMCWRRSASGRPVASTRRCQKDRSTLDMASANSMGDSAPPWAMPC
eukprot:3353079-Amphidinium_carterae.1